MEIDWSRLENLKHLKIEENWVTDYPIQRFTFHSRLQGKRKTANTHWSDLHIS